MRYGFALAATLLLETPVVWIVLGREVPGWRRIAAALSASGLTHPVFWFLMPRFFDDRWSYIATCESAIVLVEALVLRGWAGRGTWRSALAASALANGVSFLASVLHHAVT